MTKRINTDNSKDANGGMSREDRKNEAISRMIDRQDKLRQKREEKKKLAVSHSSFPLFLTLILTCCLGAQLKERHFEG